MAASAGAQALAWCLVALVAMVQQADIIFGAPKIAPARSNGAAAPASSDCKGMASSHAASLRQLEP